jgi:hypothetical protein
VGTNPPVPMGINSNAVRNIPVAWSAAWFRRFITDHLQKADFRNAIAGPGITITGTEQQTGEISSTGGGVSQIVPGTGITVSPAGGTGVVTVSSSGGAGGISTVTDGTHTVVGSTNLTVVGGTVSGTTPSPVLTINGPVGHVGVPSTILDLAFWFDANYQAQFVTPGASLPYLANLIPAYAGVPMAPAAPATPADIGLGGAISTAAGLNSLATATFVGGERYGTAAGNGSLGGLGLFLGQCTIFFVVKITTFGAGGSGTTLLGETSGGVELRVIPSGLLELQKSATSNIATSTSGITTGTYFQVNATFNSLTGAWAFRVSRTAAGSGTAGAISLSGGTMGIGWFVGGTGTPNLDLVGGLAEAIVYTRVLTLTQIQAVENYLFAKWGV